MPPKKARDIRPGDRIVSTHTVKKVTLDGQRVEVVFDDGCVLKVPPNDGLVVA